MCVGGLSSNLQTVLSGVLQGSVLGPVLLNIKVDDITNVQLMVCTMSFRAYIAS